MEKINLYNCIKDLGPVIAAFIAIGIAIWQSRLQNKQRNLSLLERRFNLYDSFKSLVNEFIDDYEHNELVNFNQIHSNFNKLIYQAEILFNEKIKMTLLDVAQEIRELDKEYSKNRKNNKKERLKYLEKHLRTSVKIVESFYKKVSEMEKEMLKFIKNSKV